MNKAYRHGENLLLKIDSLPKTAQKIKERVFAVGSHGNNHTISGGILVKDGEDLYLEAKQTSLIHKEHSPKKGDALVEDGLYKIVKQVEYTPEGLVPVVD